MRVLLINPNTTSALTETLRADFAARLSGAEIVAITAAFGSPHIGDRRSYAVARDAVLDAIERHAESADAVVIACFGDPGLADARARLTAPVIGLAEASLKVATLLGSRVGIVTGGAAWVPMLDEFVSAIGYAHSVVRIRAVPMTGLELAADPTKARDVLAAAAQRCVDEDRADVVILGGAALVGLAAPTQSFVNVRVIDCVASAVQILKEEMRARVQHR